jgi:hypothetical protein
MDSQHLGLCLYLSSVKWGSRKKFELQKGGQAGGSNAPLLYVLAADLVQCVINRVHGMGLLQLPIPSYQQAGFPIIQYADDTIILLKASQM